jgi:drug/metabolite transporter (DMT)-like permease
MVERRTDDVKGALYVLCGGICFAFCGVLIKTLSQQFGWGEIAFLRHLFAVFFFLPMLVKYGWASVASDRPWSHLARGAFGFTSYTLFVLALTRMRMGDAFSLAYTTPFWSLGLAAMLLGERIGPGKILATAAGFAGVALVVNPAGDFNEYALVALVSAALTSCAMLMVKRLSQTEPPDRIAFWFIAVGIPLGLPVAALDWRLPDLADVPWFALLGAFTWAGQRCLSRGYSIGQFSKMAPIVFVQVALANLFGAIWFGETPDAYAVLGMLLIAAGAIYIVRNPR